MLTVDQPGPVSEETRERFCGLAVYLKQSIPGLAGEPEFFQFTAGHANLTYMVKTGDRELVLKAAPPGPKAKAAHDMAREYKVLSKLYGYFPVPRPVLLCEDDSIIGGQFCVSERMAGIIVRKYPDDGSVSPQQVAAQFAGLIDGLARLHSVDYAKAGLADFGKPQGFRQRQLEGWQKRLAAAATPDMADFSRVNAWLAANSPSEAERAAVVHNDFKLDNLVWQPDDITKLMGVLDWEMATLGDPLVDLACTLSFWVEPGDPAEFQAIRNMPTARPGVMSRRQAIQRYAERIGSGMDNVDYYLCFGFLRRAAIEQQKYVRYVRGEIKDTRYANLDAAVTVLRDMCVNVIEGKVAA